MAVVGADFAALAQFDQLLEVEDGGRCIAAALGVLRQLDRALDAVELLQVAVDVDRAGHHALDVPPQHLREVGRPAGFERLAGGERHLARCGRDRQDPVAFGVGVAHYLGHRGDVDLHGVDLEIRQSGVARQPLGEALQTQWPPRIVLVRQLGVGDQHQRMQLDRAAAGPSTHADLLGVIGQQVTVDHQRSQQLVQLQSATPAEQGCDLR